MLLAAARYNPVKAIALMMHTFSSHCALMLMCPLLLYLVCTGDAFAYPAGSNNWHLNSPLQAIHNSDLVCKVSILSIHEAGKTMSSFGMGREVIRYVATAKVISIIKGSCDAVIQIQFHGPNDKMVSMVLSNWPLFTELQSGEHCLVFLRHTDKGYYLNRICSKARVVAKKVDYHQDENILIRLLSEFQAGLDAKDEMVRLQAVEELGYVGDELLEKLRPFQGEDGENYRIAHSLKEARRAIRRACLDEDIVVRSVAVMSSFKLGDPPRIDQVKAILKADPNRITSAESRSKYGIDDFCVTGLQRSLLSIMDETTRRAMKDLDDGSTMRRPLGIFRGVPGFAYADFYRWALETDLAKSNKDLRLSIANVIWIRYEKDSVPQMIQMLDDPEQSIRRTAASALKKCINGNFSNAWDRRSFYSSGFDSIKRMNEIKEKPWEQRLKDYQEHEHEYIQYWKKWWSENQERFRLKESVPVSDM